jgi:hypothetical protein
MPHNAGYADTSGLLVEHERLAFVVDPATTAETASTPSSPRRRTDLQHVTPGLRPAGGADS